MTNSPTEEDTVSSTKDCRISFYLGNKLLYLDPHVTQQVVEVEKYSDIPDQVCSLVDFLIFH